MTAFKTNNINLKQGNRWKRGMLLKCLLSIKAELVIKHYWTPRHDLLWVRCNGQRFLLTKYDMIEKYTWRPRGRLYVL